jgi:hypothetical protein
MLNATRQVCSFAGCRFAACCQFVGGRNCFSVACGLGLLVFSLAGCSSDKDSSLTADDATSKAAVATSADAPTKTSSDAAKATPPAAAAQQNLSPQKKLVREDVHTTYFEDKKIYFRRGVKLYSDDSLVNHGLYTSYYRNGQKFEEGKYADGVKQGPWHEYYDNGQEARVENYVDGKLDGAWTKFNEKGVREEEVSFKSGKRSGRWITYQPDGKEIKSQEEYQDGKPIKPAGAKGK